MASSGFTIVMDAQQVEAALTELGTQFPSFINSWLVESAILTKDEMESRAPVGVGGNYGQGISHNVGIEYDTTAGTAMIKPNSNVLYADGVETGTSPHNPPHGPDSSLAQWCELHGLNVYAVAKSISRKGTKPHPFIEPTFQVVTPIITEKFTTGVSAFLERAVAI
jgi:hypothetical protein